MRVGVDYRILASGRWAATRGMPRFTQQQLREVVRLDPDDEFVLFADRLADPSLILPEIRRAPNVEVRVVPESVGESSERYEAWIGRQAVDLYHATTPFYLEQLVLEKLDVCPMVATLYDLIPLVFPAHYLLNASLEASYGRAAELVAGATRVLAISEAARGDAHRLLGVPLARIDVAPPFAEPFFRPLPADEVDAALAGLQRRVDLPRNMVLAVSHLHYTKNVEGLLRGYSLVPAPVRRGAPLVISCHLDPHGEVRIRELARRLRISDDIVVTGLVSDAELAALYNRALLVVHPSRYEGFGLPVLEAMQCGTPVITSTSSSLPEVAGDAAVLVDPDDAPALAAAILRLHDDPAARADLSERGLRRARRYSPEVLAENTLSAYRACLSQAPPTRAEKARARASVVVVGEPNREVAPASLDGPEPGREALVRGVVHDIMTWQGGVDAVSVELRRAAREIEAELRHLADLVPSSTEPLAAAFDADAAESAPAADGSDPLLGVLSALAKPGGLVVDVGAGDGDFSLGAAAAGYAVVALDASAPAGARLRERAWRQDLDRLRIVHARIGDDSGTSPPSVAIGELLVELGAGEASFLRVALTSTGDDTVDGLSGLLSRADGPAVVFDARGDGVRLEGGRAAHLLAKMERMGYATYAVGMGRLTAMSSAAAPDVLPTCVATRTPPQVDGWVVEAPLAGTGARP